MRFATKIGAGFALVIAIAGALGFVGVLNLKRVRRDAQRLDNESVPQVALANDLERSSLMTMYNMRGYALSQDKTYLDLAKRALADVKKHLSDAEALAARYPRLTELQANAAKARNEVELYGLLAEQTVAVTTKIAELRKKQDEAAIAFMASALRCLDGQKASFGEEALAKAEPGVLQECLTKISGVQDIIDLGSDLRIANFKTQTTGDFSILEEALKRFKSLPNMVDGLTAKTHTDLFRGNLVEVLTAGNAYRDACDLVLENMRTLADLGRQRNHTAQAVLDAAHNASLSGMKDALNASALTVRRILSSTIVLILGLAITMLVGIGVSMSITKEAQRSGEERFRSVVEQSADGIVISDANGLIVEWNRAQEVITRLQRREVVGRTMWEVLASLIPGDLYEPQRSEQIERTIRTLLRRGKAAESREPAHWVGLPGGEPKMVSVRSYSVMTNGKNTVVSYFSDVTALHKAEEDKRRMEQYLQQAQKLESLGSLAGGIAHDFNNLLMGVYGFLELAKYETKDSVVLDYLSQALATSDRAKHLTQQLLTFSRGGAPNKQVTSISRLLKEVCQFATSGSSAKCAYAISKDLWVCDVDRNQIEQVVQNVMANAMQAMPHGGVIEVTASNVPIEPSNMAALKEGDYVSIAIRDSGVGMSEKTLSRVFDPFFQQRQKVADLV